MEETTLELGTVLAEKYRLDAVLGVGGMGTVYRAEHLALKAPVAIKVIDREVEDGDVALARFMQEAQSAAALRSPHVVQILDYGTEGNRPFMVMEMLEGESLSDRIKRVGRLSPADTYRVMNHVAKAVSKAHEAGIIHRDLKPDNIFLVQNEGDDIAKVLDFGVAKVDATSLKGEGHTRTGSLLGTPFYMSPEQAQGIREIDYRSDLWALGVIAFECLTGIRPFASEGLGDLVLQICIRDIPRPSEHAEVPLAFDSWFFHACQREAKDRFQSARQLAEELHLALELGDRPAGGSIDSRWSNAGAPSSTIELQPNSTRSVNAAPRSIEQTNESASERTVEPTSERSIETLSEEATVDSSRGQRRRRVGSQWEIVPHSEAARASFDGTDVPLALEDHLTIPGHESSGVGRILAVALVALLLGGAVMFGAKQAGIEIFDTNKVDLPELEYLPADKIPPPAAAQTPPKGLAKKRKKSRKRTLPEKNSKTVSEPDALHPSDPSSTEETIDTEGTVDTEETIDTEGEKVLTDKDQDDVPNSATDETLDHPGRNDAGSQTEETPELKNSDEKSENKSDKQTAKDNESGKREAPPLQPEPRLPDSLRPVPEPPALPGQ